MSYFIVTFMISSSCPRNLDIDKAWRIFWSFWDPLALIIGTAGLGILIAKHQGLRNTCTTFNPNFLKVKRLFMKWFEGCCSFDWRFLFYGSRGNNRPYWNMP